MCCVHACQEFKLSVPISLQSSDEEIEEFAVEIHKKSGSGLGITIAGLVMTDTGGNVQHVHIHIRTVCPQNLAAARFNFEALFYCSDNLRVVSIQMNLGPGQRLRPVHVYNTT